MPRLPVLLALCAAIWTCAELSPAFACACCTNIGQRNVGIVPLDSGKSEEIRQLRFAATATLFLGEGDVDQVQGIAMPTDRYKLQVSQQNNRIVFAFRDKDGHSGTLSLLTPSSIAIFEVDPRKDQREGGTGPTLYKEWKLTSKASGSGIFKPGMQNDPRITLIIQGNGNSCTSVDDFKHWTLVVDGAGAKYSLFGDLEPVR